MLLEKSNLSRWGLIILGSAVWSVTMVKSGLLYSFGLGFWGPNGHDGVWHLAMANSLAGGSLAMPIFAGETIKNYHLGFDLLLALLHRVTSLPVSLLYFQLIPPVLALSVGLLVYHFVSAWKKSAASAWWAVFFVYFGGSLGWLLGRGESAFWSQQSISSLINPPFALSLVILLAGLICIQKKYWLPAIICFAILPEIKIYIGILAFAGLVVSSLSYRQLFKVWLISGLLAALLFLPLNLGSTSLLVFRPGWFLLTLFGPDRLDWPRFFSALSTYTSALIWFKAVPAYALALVIFLLGNLGTRLLAVGSFHRHLSWEDHLFLTIISLGIIFPMLFVQRGTSWNTIQFFYYVLFVCSLYAGISLAGLSAKIKSPFLTAIVYLLVIGLTLPTTIVTLGQYLPARAPAKISLNELSALTFLARQTPGIVLTYPFDKDAADAALPYPPRPLYLYESTAYVSAYSAQPTFLADQVNLDITGYSWQVRRAASLDFFAHPSVDFLVQNHIKYLYLSGPSAALFDPRGLPVSKLFSNSDSVIYALD